MSENIEKQIGRFVRSYYRFKNKLKINKKDADLLERISNFAKECRRLTHINYDYEDDHGVTFQFSWEEQIGFTYLIHTKGALCQLEEKNCNKTFKDYFDELKLQASIFRKRRKDLAKLIRLKNRMKIPGPVSKATFACEENGGSCIFFHELTQEEIDEILKY